jgi:Rod binding domain-containing protein
MSVSAISSAAAPAAADVDPQSLAGNQSLTEKQKIAEASRQFEAILLRQILSETQKPVITSEFTDNSTAAGIYQDFIVNQMSDSLSKSGALGFAKIFEQQLSHPDHKIAGGVSQPATKIPSSSHHE